MKLKDMWTYRGQVFLVCRIDGVLDDWKVDLSPWQWATKSQ